ncbi:MAG: right-handed parallel beta-helix repeat-containing protein [Ruminococcaceae bacterium]|nr:right-handed parallel beta-helix repeat-containing protein [Oscillospiraceae bacterium]
MKRVVSLILVLFVSFGVVASANAVSIESFSEKLNLIRIIRGMFSKDDDNAPMYGELEDGVLTVYVSSSGKQNARGTKNDPFPTIEAARDAVRSLDKSSLSGIDIIIEGGTYHITETIEFTSADTGSESCPIRYIGEDGAVINGGTSFDYTAFEKASGDTLALFPEDVQDKLYMLDLGKFGYTADDIAEMLTNKKYYNKASIILVNGQEMTLARYPNADEGWIEIEGGYFLDGEGNVTLEDYDSPKELHPKATVIEYGNEHMERVLSWKNREDLFVRGHYRFIWFRDDTGVTELYDDSDTMLLPYSNGWNPVEGGLLYFYNIPEELDVPGEFYIDHSAVLYYYPEEDFETAYFTMPLLDGSIVDITDAEYLTFENITFESSLKSGITFETNNLTITSCTIQGVYGKGVKGTGVNFKFIGNEIGYVGENGIVVTGGEAETLTKSNNLICNNYIHNWDTRTTLAFGVEMSGCGGTVCHNEVTDSTDLGVATRGPLHLIEYNYIHDTCQFFCDGGTLSMHGYAYGTICRYNVVMNTGYYSMIDIVGVQGITVDEDSLGATVYGNIVYNCTGHGLSLAYSRDSKMTNNLIIKAGRSAFQAISPTYNSDWLAGEPKNRKVNAKLQSELWQETFPELKGIHGSFDPENAFDPMYLRAPGNNVVKDNYFFFDKSYRTWLPSQQYKSTKLMDVEDAYFLMSEIEDISVENGRVTVYNSKRNKTPITIAEALETANAACGTVMTPEQLAEVGLIGVEHGIGDIFVE